MEPVVVEIEGVKYAKMGPGGHPLYLSDGKEIEVDAAHATKKIAEVQAEAKNHRVGKEEAEAKLKAFEGISDPAAAIKAMDTVKNLDDKTLVDAGKVEEIKAAAIKATEEKYKPIQDERDKLKSDLDQEMIGGRFARSKFIQDNIAVPADMIENQFRKNFSIEDGKVVAKDNNGNMIYSKTKPGEIADFDEALEAIVEGYAHKDNILKGTGHKGSGSEPGGGGGGRGGGTGSTMSRAEFDKLAQSDPAAASKIMSKGEVTLVD